MKLEIKQCIDCRMHKPVNRFYIHKKPLGDVYTAECKECRKERVRKWRLANPEKYKDQYGVLR